MADHELRRVREDYEHALKQTPAEPEEISVIIRHCFRPRFVPEQEQYREVATGVSGSLKAVETLALKMETREIRRQQLDTARRIGRRRRAFQLQAGRPSAGVSGDYAEAVTGLSAQDFTEETFGTLLGITRNVWLAVVEDCVADERFGDACRHDVDRVFRGGDLLVSEYDALAAWGARIFETVQDNEDDLREVARALELLDIAFLIQNVIDVGQGSAVWRAVARFFDRTLNNHIFDYIPYHYHSERTYAFKNWQRSRLIEFAEEHHTVLHRLIAGLLKDRSDLAGTPQRYQDLLLGSYDGELKLVSAGIGIDTASEIEARWFSYARLRDLATLVHDGYPLPEAREDWTMGPGVNVAIVYPIGNTTVSVALEQCIRLSREGVNLFSAPFPRIVKDDAGARLVVREVFFRDGENTWVLARLREDLPVHAVWFHFTHFLRAHIEEVGLPLIQPLLWEAATYLKCDLPAMLKGSGVSCPDQRNWFGNQSVGLDPGRAREQIRELVREMAARHNTLIVKAEKESGGRRSRILSVARNGAPLSENIETLTSLVYDISRTDNAVIQEVIPSKVRQLYSREFLDLVRERFISELGIGIQDDSPLFSYFRLVVVKDPRGGYTVTHRITVVSTAGVANVGQGGRLFEYRDEKIDPRYRDDLREELERAAFSSLHAQEAFIAENRERILRDYLEAHPELALDRQTLTPSTNALMRPDHEILYEMGDYMCVLLVDAEDRLARVYHHEAERFIPLFVDRKPNMRLEFFDRDGTPVPSPFDLYREGTQRELYWRYDGGTKRRVRSVAVVKIEPNPGAGLWRPHNDRLKLVGRDGEGVFRLFKVLAEWGTLYREKTM